VVVFTMLAVESFDPRLILGFYKFARGELRKEVTICLIAIRHALRSLNRRNVPKKRTALLARLVHPILAAVVGAWVAVTRV